MKYLLVLPSLLFFISVHGQNKDTKIIGKYQDHFGNEITINPDSTFKYTWHFDLGASWSNGRWYVNKDTIFFRKILVYDTLRTTNSEGKIVDQLVIAQTEKPQTIVSALSASGLSLLSGQNSIPCPNKLFYRHDKLYGIMNNGTLNRKRVRGIWSKRKFDPMYHKEPEK